MNFGAHAAGDHSPHAHPTLASPNRYHRTEAYDDTASKRKRIKRRLVVSALGSLTNTVPRLALLTYTSPHLTS